MSYKRKIAVLLVVVTLLLCGCNHGDVEVVWSDELSQNVLFKIEDGECTMATAKLLMATYKNLYVEVYGENVWQQQKLSVEIEQYLKETIISQLARIETMCLLAETRNVVLSGDEKKTVETAAAEFFATLSEDEVEELDISEKEVEEFFMEYALANKLFAKLTQGIDEEVSDNDARVMEVMCIVVEDLESAEAVQERLAEGGDFQATANYYSLEEQCNRFLYWKDITQEEKNVLNLLEAGDVSESILVDGKYYIYQCVEKINRQLTEENKLMILQERAKVAFDDVYDAFVKTLHSSYNEELWENYTVDFSEKMDTNELFEIYEKHCGFLNSEE